MPTTIFREFTFEAAHRLPNVPDGHKCRKLHGHSYRVQLRVSGDVDPKMGWFCDWADLDFWAGDIRTVLDHQTLNEVPGLENPTTEVLAKWIWDKLQPRAPGLSLVTVFEGPRSGVEYSEDA